MTENTESYDAVQWRLLRHFANSEADDMDVEAMAWACREIERLRAALLTIESYGPNGDALDKAVEIARLALTPAASRST